MLKNSILMKFIINICIQQHIRIELCFISTELHVYNMHSTF